MMSGSKLFGSPKGATNTRLIVGLYDEDLPRTSDADSDNAEMSSATRTHEARATFRRMRAFRDYRQLAIFVPAEFAPAEDAFKEFDLIFVIPELHTRISMETHNGISGG